MSDQYLHVKVTSELKSLAAAAAEAEGISLTQLVTRVLDERLRGRCASCGRPGRSVVLPPAPPVDEEELGLWIERSAALGAVEVALNLLVRSAGAPCNPLAVNMLQSGAEADEFCAVGSRLVEQARRWMVGSLRRRRFTVSAHRRAGGAPFDQYVFVLGPT